MSDSLPPSLSVPDLPLATPEERIASLVRRYRLASFQKKTAEASLESVKAELQPLLESQGEFADERGFAKIVPGGTESVAFVSSDHTKTLVFLMRQWLASPDAALAEAGRALSELIEMKEPKKPYVLVK